MPITRMIWHIFSCSSVTFLYSPRAKSLVGKAWHYSTEVDLCQWSLGPVSAQQNPSQTILPSFRLISEAYFCNVDGKDKSVWFLFWNRLNLSWSQKHTCFGQIQLLNAAVSHSPSPCAEGECDTVVMEQGRLGGSIRGWCRVDFLCPRVSVLPSWSGVWDEFAGKPFIWLHQLSQ